MSSIIRLAFLATLVSHSSAHALVTNAQGLPGSPASVGFQVVESIARNCTSINPCQQDATLIRDAEIAANVVNECGRTELQGNIDIGENTENALAIKAVTQVQSGSDVVITMHQVNADGAGPFACDMDPTSNGLGLTGQIPLEIVGENIPGANGLSQSKTQDFNLTVRMPADMKCIGASTGNVCTVRCRNNAQAGPFGGCFPVQQVDVQPNQNTPQNVAAFKSLNDVNSQIDANTKAFPAAVAGIQQAGSDESKQAASVANAITGGLPNVNPIIASAQQANETAAAQGGNAAQGEAAQKGGNAAQGAEGGAAQEGGNAGQAEGAAAQKGENAAKGAAAANQRGGNAAESNAALNGKGTKQSGNNGNQRRWSFRDRRQISV